MVYEASGDFDRGIADMTRAIQLGPDSAHDYLPFRSLIHLHRKADAISAMADLNALLERQPDDALGLALRSVLHQRQGEVDKARIDKENAASADWHALNFMSAIERRLAAGDTLVEALVVAEKRQPAAVAAAVPGAVPVPYWLPAVSAPYAASACQPCAGRGATRQFGQGAVRETPSGRYICGGLCPAGRPGQSLLSASTDGRRPRSA